VPVGWAVVSGISAILGLGFWAVVFVGLVSTAL
jgi:hypothetical protein